MSERALSNPGLQVPGRTGLASVTEAEQFLSVSRTTLYGLMSQGKVRFVKIGKSRRIPWAALEELAQVGVAV